MAGKVVTGVAEAGKVVTGETVAGELVIGDAVAGEIVAGDEVGVMLGAEEDGEELGEALDELHNVISRIWTAAE